MKRKYKTLVLDMSNEAFTKMEEKLSIMNYSHYTLKNGGVILSSNKGIGLPDIFIPYERIQFIA